MKIVTRDILSEGAERAWINCFGVPSEMVELPIETEADRVFAAAVVLADDLRYLPEYALAQAGPEERFLFSMAFCRLLRDVEAGRIGCVGQPAGAGP